MSYNKIKYSFAGVALAMGAMLTGCDSLDIENMTSYDENTVWADPNLTQAYVNNLYTLCFGNWSSGADNNSDQVTGMVWYLGTITETGGSYKSWDYASIRKINDAIVRLEDNDVLSKNVADQMLGEALFMRAYKYYNIVIYHGGVPYIKVPQDKDADDLYVKRNSTKECFQFMIEDLDKAISLLPAKSVDNNYGRIDGVFARAFKAKVLLLKCSPQFNPSNQWDNQYWAEAYAAAKEAYDFAVANGSELTKKYSDIWAVEQGPEVIFPVINSNPNRISSYIGNTRPTSVSRSTNSSNPTWEFVKSVPMADGKMWDDPTGKYYVAGGEEAFAQKFWVNRDPRFYEAVLYNGADFPVAEKPSNYRQYNALGLVDKDDAYGVNPTASVNAVNNDVYSGFYNYKGHDNSLTQANVLTYDYDYQLMRFPEVMFIYAEAANETGHQDAAIDMLRQIRERAGIEAGADGNYGMDLSSRTAIRAAILAERNVELCFEGHRFWDLRRTRNMMQLADQTKHGLEAIAINPDGTDMDLATAYEKVRANEMKPGDFRYVIHRVPYTEAMEHEMVIKESFYFFPIQFSNIQQNPNLEQNNNWGGTFNPTME